MDTVLEKRQQELSNKIPEWWKQTRTYEVQKQEGNTWVTKMTCDYEDIENFRILSNLPFYRILKNGVDITNKYSLSATTVEEEPQPVKKPVNLKPAEYKALPLDKKKELWNKVIALQNRKAKRAEIFEELLISEATYDTIRNDLKNIGEEDNKVAKETPRVEPKQNSTEKPKVHRGPSLF